MSKQCPQCRAITANYSAVSCDSCGFRFVHARADPSSFAGLCMRIGSSVLVLAAITAVAYRFL